MANGDLTTSMPENFSTNDSSDTEVPLDSNRETVDESGTENNHQTPQEGEATQAPARASLYASFILVGILLMFLLFCLIMKIRSNHQGKNSSTGRILLTPKPAEANCYIDSAGKSVNETEKTLPIEREA